MIYEVVIGLEVHAQLLTASKIFCGCSAKFGLRANSSTCPVCLGLPGALPVLNKQVVEYAMKMILAVGGMIANNSVFARKNYFYPDLPKGYQISQFDQPIGVGGVIEFDDKNTRKKIKLTRIHLEEDAGKSLHPENESQDFTCIDVNRCGVPLIEIVSEPDIRTAHEAYLYLHRLKQIVEYLGICDGNMEEGSLRCDANISLRPEGSSKLGTRTEVKNLNSIRGVEKALTFEINRQREVLESGGTVKQSTLLYNDSDGKCYPMRSKEESHDYRYFPDPDLKNLQISSEWIENIKKTLPELPQQKLDRFISEYKIPSYDAEVLTTTKQLADYFEETVTVSKDAKLSANWIMTEVLSILKEKNISINDFTIAPSRLGQVVSHIKAGKITGKIAKQLLAIMLTDDRNIDEIIQEKGLAPITDSSELNKMIDNIILEHVNEVEKYRAGKKKLFSFFIGELMKATKGKADPQVAAKLFKNKLES